ncbi:hypothetical protein NBZ79_11275 [Sneathiella marina]|uniref:Uncharacterized protein n=1 Tax=Sneathiella marina TaxID=2950108 RepID=A0ABY4VXV3_9PROT|nr:hypothetical protein [Sneathiella marina]USG59758.1 hypothetical protein NBZ79_11275 [Sneathiella marina]
MLIDTSVNGISGLSAPVGLAHISRDPTFASYGNSQAGAFRISGSPNAEVEARTIKVTLPTNMTTNEHVLDIWPTLFGGFQSRSLKLDSAGSLTGELI